MAYFLISNKSKISFGSCQKISTPTIWETGGPFFINSIICLTFSSSPCGLGLIPLLFLLPLLLGLELLSAGESTKVEHSPSGAVYE